MHRHSYDDDARRIADGRIVKPPRRGVFGAGIAMLIIGSGAILATWPVLFFNSVAQVGAGPLAVTGAMMVGAARGRRRARRDHFKFAPYITRTTTMLSLGMRW